MRTPKVILKQKEPVDLEWPSSDRPCRRDASRTAFDGGAVMTKPGGRLCLAQGIEVIRPPSGSMINTTSIGEASWLTPAA